MFRLIRATLGLVVLLVVASLALPAAAQNPSFTLTVSGSDPITVRGGQSQTVSLTVTLMGDHFGCVQDTPLPVTVAATANRLTPTVNPAELSFATGASLYASDVEALGPYNQSQPVSVAIGAPSGTTADFNGQVSVTATFPGGNYGPPDGTCGVGEFPGAEGGTSIQVNVLADAAPTGGGDGGTGDGGDGGTGDGGDGGSMDGGDGEDTDDSPLGPVLVPLALLGAALIARRRRA